MSKTMLTLHRWLGLVAGLMILIAAGTAIGLNHQDVFKKPMTLAESGPYGKYALAVAVDPTDPDHLLLGTNDGLYRSEDGGASWDEAVLPVPAEQVNTLLFDPKQPEVVYAAFRSIGVYKSTDGGAVWEEVPLPFYAPEGTEIAGIALGGSGELVLATTAGVYHQAGGDWRHVPRPGAPSAEQARGTVQLIYDLHDGRFWGTWGVPITDAVSAALIVLVLTGYVLFFGRWLKVRAARRRARETAPTRELETARR